MRRSAKNALWRSGGIALVLAAAPFFPGCRCQPLPGEDEYRDGLRFFLRQEYGRAEPRLRAALAEELPAGRTAEVHYLLGAIALRRGSAYDARLHFQECLRGAGNEELQINAALGIARSHAQTGDNRQCREACLDILRGHPHCPRSDEVYFVMAEASRGAGLSAEAQEYYRKAAAGRTGLWAKQAAERLRGGEAPPQASILPAAAATGQFFVQVAALKSAPRAAEQANDLRKKGYPAAASEARVGREDLHLVQVGPYATREEAKEAASRLKADGVESTTIKSAGDQGPR